MQQQPQQREKQGQSSFIPPFVRELVYFDKTQYQPTTPSSSFTNNPNTQHPPPSIAQTPFEYVSDDGLVILEAMQTCLPASVVQSHIPTASRPEEFDPFRQSCVAVLSKLTRLLSLQQQNQSQYDRDSNDVADTTKATKALLDLYDVDGLGPWLGEAGKRATEVWFDAFVRGVYDQAWLVGSTVLEQLIVNIIYTLQGPEKFIPFLVRDLLSVPCLTNSKFVDRTLIRVIKTLMGSPLTLNIRNLLWHGFVTPQDHIPLDAYGAMLIVTTMSIAVGVRRTMVKELQIRYGGVPREERFYFRQEQEVDRVEKEEAVLEGFDAVFERVAYRGGRLRLLTPGSLEEGVYAGQDRDWDWDQVRAVLEAIVRRSSFVICGTVQQWICALQHLQSANTGIPTSKGRSSFMFVMASLPLLEHGLRLIYVRVNGCKQDRTCALVAGEYYLTLDVILDEFVPPEYYDADAEELKRYRADEIPNRLFSELGSQAMNLLQDLFLAALGPRLRDRTSHGENNAYFTTDVRTDQPWFDYYLGVVFFLLTLDSTTTSKEYESVVAETQGWVRMYAERRFDEWSALRKETVRALCTVLEYPRAVQNVGNSKEGEMEALTGSDCLLVAEVEEPRWITLRLKPRLSVVFTNKDTFITDNVNKLSTVQDRIRICLTAWPTRPSSCDTQNTINKYKKEEGKEIQGMASNLPAWILIVQSVQAAAEKVTAKLASFLELQRQRQLSSRSRKQLEGMRPLIPEWLGMLVGCLALVEHFVLLAEEEGGGGGDDDEGMVVASARKDESYEKAVGGVNGSGNSNNSNNGKKKNGKKGKGEEEKVAGTVVDKSSAAEIRLRLAIVQFLNKFVSNFERVKLPMIEAAWLDLVKSADSVLSLKK